MIGFGSHAEYAARILQSVASKRPPFAYSNRASIGSMAGHRTSRWELLEDWTPLLFLAASGLFAGHAMVRGIEAFTTVPPPVDVFGPTGYVAALLGLVGLYPALTDRAPRISRVAAGTAVVLAPAWALVGGWNVGEAAGVLPPQTAVVPGGLFAVLVASTLLLYVLFGVASLRADSHAQLLGVLLLAPAALLVLLIVGGALLSIAPEAGGTVVGSGLAIVHGAVGGTLLTGRTETDHVDPAADATVE